MPIFSHEEPMDFSSLNIPLPLPDDHRVEDYLPYALKLKRDWHEVNDVLAELKKYVLLETCRTLSCDEDSATETVIAMETDASPRIPKDEDVFSREEEFGRRFAHLIHTAPIERLISLMECEQQMARKMLSLTRARNWEMDRLTSECEGLLAKAAIDDINAYNLTKLNEKMRQVHSSYSCQIDALADEQRGFYRAGLDAIAKGQAFSFDVVDDMGKNMPSLTETPSFANANELDESFTIYIGAQMKSMHNFRLITSPSLAAICSSAVDSDVNVRMQSAMTLYGRPLTANILLVAKDPLWHVKEKSEFSKSCGQSTELHFDTLKKQLDGVAESVRRANSWRSNLSDCENRLFKESLTDIHSLIPGDVYCTTHSNLKRAQVVFHLVVDETLSCTDISSRHSCFSALRNIVRLSARLGIHNLYIPLLLIESASEATTVAWCMRRAEMVFKCIKGYLIEVCGCAGVASSPPHYNVNFVLPSGLLPSIYSQITDMLPSIFHLVPTVSSAARLV